MYLDEKTLLNEICKEQEHITENFTDALLTLSYRYLDQYYLQVRRHSERSLFLTLVFAVFGSFTILAGVLASLFWGLAEQSYVSVGAGVLVDLISSVFFYMYNQTTKEMNAYYDRLVLAQNLAIAIKSAELLDSEDQAKELTAIITALVSNYNEYLFKNSVPLNNLSAAAKKPL